MKRVLAALVLTAVLTACGEESDRRADDTTSTSPTTTSTPADAPRVVEIVSGSAVGGEVETEATLIEDDRDLFRYARQFESPSFLGDLIEAVASVPRADDRVAGVAVIAIGCDVPPGATVTEEDGAFVVTPEKVVSPHMECVVAVTSVAVLDLPRR